MCVCVWGGGGGGMCVCVGGGICGGRGDYIEGAWGTA